MAETANALTDEIAVVLCEQITIGELTVAEAANFMEMSEVAFRAAVDDLGFSVELAVELHEQGAEQAKGKRRTRIDPAIVKEAADLVEAALRAGGKAPSVSAIALKHSISDVSLNAAVRAELEARGLGKGAGSGMAREAAREKLFGDIVAHQNEKNTSLLAACKAVCGNEADVKKVYQNIVKKLAREEIAAAIEPICKAAGLRKDARKPKPGDNPSEAKILDARHRFRSEFIPPPPGEKSRSKKSGETNTNAALVRWLGKDPAAYVAWLDTVGAYSKACRKLKRDPVAEASRVLLFLMNAY